MRRWILPALPALTLLVGDPAPAAEPAKAPPQESVDLARKHYLDGARLFEAGKYDLARVEFDAAFALTREPDLLHNLAITAEKQGQLFDAIQYEDEFLRAKRAELTAQEIEQTERRLARWHLAMEAKRPAPVPPPGPAVPRLAIGLMAGGAAVVVLGAGLGGAALADRNRLYGGVYADEVDALLDRNRALNASAISLCVIGGVALAAGASWTVVERVRRPGTPKAAAGALALGLDL